MTVIAIDGPSGVGKSSTCKEIARILGYDYIDTGSYYRAVTAYFVDNIDSFEYSADRLKDLEISITPDPDEFRIFIDNVEYTDRIRMTDIAANVSEYASKPEVRKFLNKIFDNKIEISQISSNGVVVEGRDATTVICPNALLRILLTASDEVRQARRDAQVIKSTNAHKTDAEIKAIKDAKKHPGTLAKEAKLAAEKDDVKSRDSKDKANANFETPAEGVILVDNSNLTFDQTVDHILDLFEVSLADEEDDEFNDFDESEFFDDDSVPEKKKPANLKTLPTVAVIGRPNVGKSTLVNRITRTNKAVVEHIEGVTRDRVTYTASYEGKDFAIVDTGGWDKMFNTPEHILNDLVSVQSEYASQYADVLVLVVDTQQGIVQTDEDIIKTIRRLKKPVILCANKADKESDALTATGFWNLGMGEPTAISALNGIDVDVLLDRIIEALPDDPEHPTTLGYSLPQIAILGKPNVGKSSLLNMLSGEQRSVVSDIPGTTRDPIDEIITLDGDKYCFVDTAGIKRRFKSEQGSDYFAVLRTFAALKRADVGLCLIDGSEPISVQDIKVVSEAAEQGVGIVLVINKWDDMDAERKVKLEEELEREFGQWPWILRVNLSAKTGWHTSYIKKNIDIALESRKGRITTGKLNSWLGDIVASNPHRVRNGRQPKLRFITQVDVCPPKFNVYTTMDLDDTYRRYLIRMLRETFGFEGSPIRLAVIIKEKYQKKK